MNKLILITAILLSIGCAQSKDAAAVQSKPPGDAIADWEYERYQEAIVNVKSYAERYMAAIYVPVPVSNYRDFCEKYTAGIIFSNISFNYDCQLIRKYEPQGNK